MMDPSIRSSFLFSLPFERTNFQPVIQAPKSLFQAEGLAVVDSLQFDEVDAIIVANPIYKKEIASKTSSLGLTPEFLYL